MGVFWTGLAWFLGTFATKLVYRIFAAVGVSFVTYQGMDWALDELSSRIAGTFGGMTQTMLSAVWLLNIDKSMSVILSAYAAVAFLAGSKLIMSKMTEGN